MSNDRLRHYGLATVFSAGAVAFVTAAIALFEPYVPVLSLGVLYIFAVLPVAVVWGLRFALLVSVASMLAFNWFFLPPRHTFTLADSENWFALAVYLATAVVVSELAARSRRRAAAAEQRERESALLADLAAELLAGRKLEDEVGEIAGRAARVLGVESAAIELGPPAEGGRLARRLSAGGHRTPDRDDLHAGRRRPRSGRSSPVPPGSRGVARGRRRAGAARERGGRGGDAAAQRPRQDGAPPRRVARPAHAAHGHPDCRRHVAGPRAQSQRHRPGRLARDDRAGVGPSRTASSATCSISRGWRRARPRPSSRPGT